MLTSIGGGRLFLHRASSPHFYSQTENKLRLYRFVKFPGTLIPSHPYG